MKNYSDKKIRLRSTVLNILLTLLLFLYTFNITNRYYYLSYVFIVICVFWIIKNRTIHKSWQTLFVVVFLIGYWACARIINGENRTELVVQCLIFYIFGALYYRGLWEKQNERWLFNIVFWGAFGFALYGTITSFTSVLDSGRYMQDFWGGGTLAATQVAGWCICFMAFVPWAVFKSGSLKMWRKVLIYLMTIFCILSFFILSSRTGLLVSGLVLSLILILAAKARKNKVVTWFLIVAIVIILAFAFNIGGLQDIFWKSNLITRMLEKRNSLGSAFDTGRTDRWLYLIIHWAENLNGGYYFSNMLNGQMHNMVFDIYDECGIIAFVLIVIVIIRTITGLWKLAKSNHSFENKAGLICWYAIIAVLLFSEPVIYYGRTNFMAFFFFMIGITEFMCCIYGDSIGGETKE